MACCTRTFRGRSAVPAAEIIKQVTDRLSEHYPHTSRETVAMLATEA